MNAIDLVELNLLSPMVLSFALGVGARLLKSDLQLPESVYLGLATYLLFAIGMKGGAALSATPLAEILAPALVTVLLGVLIPFLTYIVLKPKLGVADAAALAAHYGSVSAVTFIASQSFLDLAGIEYEGFMPALVAVLEVPAIIAGLLLGSSARTSNGKGGEPLAVPLSKTLHEILTGKSIVLLLGGMLIGWASGEKGFIKVAPFFVEPFQGVLCLFLLEMGLLAASRLRDLRKVGPVLVAFAILAPPIFGALGILGGKLSGLSQGGSTVLGAMAASASYIAAPAAVRMALPQANPSYYLTASVGLTFPFNLALGIPLYFAMSRFLFHAGS